METNQEIKKTDLVSIRNWVSEDKNFIMATMLRGLYYGQSVFSEMQKQTFMVLYNQFLEVLLNKNTTIVKVACLKEDPSVILGYAVFNSPNTLSWVFVKKSWRNIGLAKDLIPKEVTTVTHLTKTGLSLIKNKGLIFNPFAL